MRTHLLALATSAALVVTFGSFEASAQQRPDYGPGWHDHQGDGYRGRRNEQSEGYGRDSRDERGEDYGRGRRERGEGYGRGRRQDRGEGYGRRDSDRRDDGMMEHGMMRQGHMDPGMMGPAMMRMMLVLMDTDGDGTVSLSEFQTAHERIFKALDANKDGRLTVQEVQAFFQGQNEMKTPDRRPSQRDSSTQETRPAQPDGNPAQ
jgi:hypothetical protein